MRNRLALSLETIHWVPFTISAAARSRYEGVRHPVQLEIVFFPCPPSCKVVHLVKTRRATAEFTAPTAINSHRVVTLPHAIVQTPEAGIAQKCLLSLSVAFDVE